MESKIVTVGSGKVKQVKIGEKLPLVFIGGPCAIESRLVHFLHLGWTQVLVDFGEERPGLQ